MLKEDSPGGLHVGYNLDCLWHLRRRVFLLSQFSRFTGVVWRSAHRTRTPQFGAYWQTEVRHCGERRPHLVLHLGVDGAVTQAICRAQRSSLEFYSFKVREFLVQSFWGSTLQKHR